MKTIIAVIIMAILIASCDGNSEAKKHFSTSLDSLVEETGKIDIYRKFYIDSFYSAGELMDELIIMKAVEDNIFTIGITSYYYTRSCFIKLTEEELIKLFDDMDNILSNPSKEQTFKVGMGGIIRQMEVLSKYNCVLAAVNDGQINTYIITKKHLDHMKYCFKRLNKESR